MADAAAAGNWWDNWSYLNADMASRTARSRASPGLVSRDGRRVRLLEIAAASPEAGALVIYVEEPTSAMMRAEEQAVAVSAPVLERTGRPGAA